MLGNENIYFSVNGGLVDLCIEDKYVEVYVRRDLPLTEVSSYVWDEIEAASERRGEYEYLASSDWRELLITLSWEGFVSTQSVDEWIQTHTSYDD